MSVTCSKPSMPPRSMKAPYSVRFFTTPVTTEPSTRCSSVALLRTLISSSTAVLRETTTLPRRRLSLMILTGMSCPTRESRLWTGRGSACDPAVEFDDFDGDVLPNQGIQVVDRTRIGLRSGHKGFDADIHGEPAFDAAEHPAGKHQLFLVSLFEILPNPQARGPSVRKQNVSFGLLAAVIDHDVDRVAALHE